MLAQTARYVAVGSLFFFGIWPFLVYPFWPVWSVCDALAWLIRSVDPSLSGVLVTSLVTFPALSSLGILQLANTTVPIRRRVARAVVMILAGYPLGFSGASGTISARDILALLAAPWLWLVAGFVAVVVVAKGLVFLTVSLPLVLPAVPSGRLQNAATRWLARV